MSEPSERMQQLIAALEASTIAGHDMHVNALKAAIAAIEQRAEKAEAERDVFEEHAAAQVREIREWIERVNKWKCVAVAMEKRNSGEILNDWTLITSARKQVDAAIAALGDEWTEAVK